MPKKADLDDNAVLDYSEAHSLRRESLVESILKLTKRTRANGVSPGERAEIEAEIADLRADKALHDAKRIAFDANRHVISPPSPEQLSALQSIVARVEQLTANAEAASRIVDLTAESLATFRQIHSDQG